MKYVIAHGNKRYAPHIRYAFRTLLEWLGITNYEFKTFGELAMGVDPGCVIISYGWEPPREPRPHIHVKESDFFNSGYGTPASMPKLPPEDWDGLPVLFGEPSDGGAWMEEDGGRVHCRADLVAGIFFLLSRYEEIVVKERDRFQRFPAQASYLSKAGLLRRPLADEYVDLIAEWMERFDPEHFKKRFQNAPPFTLYVTHDVDAPFKYAWRGLFTFKHPPGRALSHLLGKKRDPYWTFPELMALEEKYGVKADYFFMADGEHKLDRGYELGSPRIRKLISELRGMGHGVGIHFSLSSHFKLIKTGGRSRDPSMRRFAEELTRFIAVTRQSSIGSRQHYLAMDVPLTWKRLNDLGIPFDSSAGFSEEPGFRCGSCRPFRCFDAKEGAPMRLVEIPLVAMDASYVHYKKSSPEGALADMKRLLETVEKRRGVFTLLWHNNILCENEYPGWKETYRRFLEYAVSKNPRTSCPVDAETSAITII